jgi:hypothetical protein
VIPFLVIFCTVAAVLGFLLQGLKNNKVLRSGPIMVMAMITVFFVAPWSEAQFHVSQFTTLMALVLAYGVGVIISRSQYPQGWIPKTEE